ncbi:glycosyltransferase family 2 protein [Psychrobacter sp. ANT_WB68]|uniref:glycosyltransferase family 2 protein n=1 Tax=Psychrobacter sp. ANT_WB68 TaxID=2597355 RepID=UPI0011F35FB5|nr:glycosyltransferase family 2 protein [Psychrobacter sp. ANT_WB68]KAA0913671.1 glycosyltransferase [Psychrobacter sp. ANT_WB68]
MTQKNLAIVVVTYNRLKLLTQCLQKLEKQTYAIDSLIVVNNASTDGVTASFLDSYKGNLPLTVIHNEVNTGGAGGFYTGIRYAHQLGYEWIFIMDDDVFADSRCIEQLMKVAHPCMVAVREYKDGQLVERAAIEYNLSNPFYLNPKRQAVCDKYKNRSDMPATIEVDNVAFEGFMIKREVIDIIGYPEPKYFIFYDDVDYALRARKAGYSIKAVRDAKLIRQLPFDQQGAIDSWKAFYMFRNLFHIHFKFGKNVFVRNKPYLLMIGSIAVYCIKLRSWRISKEIIRALKCAKYLTKE